MLYFYYVFQYKGIPPNNKETLLQRGSTWNEWEPISEKCLRGHWEGLKISCRVFFLQSLSLIGDFLFSFFYYYYFIFYLFIYLFLVNNAIVNMILEILLSNLIRDKITSTLLYVLDFSIKM